MFDVNISELKGITSRTKQELHTASVITFHQWWLF